MPYTETQSPWFDEWNEETFVTGCEYTVRRPTCQGAENAAYMFPFDQASNHS